MSLRKLPAIQARKELQDLDTGIAPAALDRWNAGIRPAAEGDNAIDIFDAIGEDPWTGGGVTAKSVAAELRRIAGDVVVNINSPGGDLFEGIAIYNLLREHPHRVTVKIISLAASAASIVAMAGDAIRIAKSGFIMIHNAWVLAIGDRHDMREIADMLEPFDATIAGIYADRTGIAAPKIGGMMDDDTWIDGAAAVEQKFADSLLEADETKDSKAAASQMAPIVAARRIDVALARQGMPRAQRPQLIKEIKGGTPGAAAAATPSAGDPVLAAALLRTILTLKT
jgi:ATP-dependent protease ClpP protease subunit